MEAINKMDLFKLVKLQEIDKRLMELEDFKGDLPEQVDDLRNKISALNENLNQQGEGNGNR